MTKILEKLAGFSIALPLCVFVIQCQNSLDSKADGLVGQDPKSSKDQSAWSLVWSDEFGATELNQQSWNYDIGRGTWGWGNDEKQYYTDQQKNVRVENGNLIISAVQEDYQGSRYTSARVNTQGKAKWKYAKVEVRAKIPAGDGGAGLWPTIWLMPEVSHWPYTGEIDIMEAYSPEMDTVWGNTHWWAPNVADGFSANNQTPFTNNGISFADDFHIYSLEWDSTKIDLLVDGIRYYRKVAYGNADDFPYTTEFHLLLNMAVGGRAAEQRGPLNIKIFPQEFTIDYVRVYQKK
jgi:beta-glucanase (GH16 family)